VHCAKKCFKYINLNSHIYRKNLRLLGGGSFAHQGFASGLVPHWETSVPICILLPRKKNFQLRHCSMRTGLEEFGGNAARFSAAVPPSTSELLLTLADRLGNGQRHLADEFRLAPAHLVMSRAVAARFATHSLHVT